LSPLNDRLTSEEVSESPPTPPSQAPEGPQSEARRDRLGRHGRHTGLYFSAFFLVALLVVLVILIGKNTRSVKLDWAVGSTQASLVWIILAAAVLGWLLGIATSVVFRHRTRRRT
jgi:uncharacterized integral membrane protein